VKTVAGYRKIDELFHGDRSERWREEAGEPVTSTTTFVAELAAGHHQVVDFSELDFDFIDREILPLRSTSTPVEGRGARRSIDLLLRQRITDRGRAQRSPAIVRPISPSSRR
jgi:hypothetical protein